ncbi:MAG: hypothetical protein QF921_18145 [Pseudomonadales bacterium]|jgi:hypothetical protein|nr:hypothetical protein [Pseudomonadales bacterium]MDP6470464.1 hypothetical protein [Pseudomonadales bacterium]MDP6827766.1 hypothetical protein [Pseudomonadales bacterium]MDP6973408.1 hypothetical protein [Pseudomonadales bacterium]|tara:strand:+ start:4711 stop:4995 length:285 start_codon:yes stop_codon:yes gene_type:complete
MPYTPSPESGAEQPLKHLLIVYHSQTGNTARMAKAALVGAMSDAVRSIRRIANGYPFRQIQEPVVAQGSVTDTHLQRCRDLGTALALGLFIGVF